MEIEFHAFPSILDRDERSARLADCSIPAERNVIPIRQDDGWQRRSQVFWRLGRRRAVAARNRNNENETNRNYLLNSHCFFQCFRIFENHLFFKNVYFSTHLESAVWSVCTNRPSLATPLLGRPQS